MQDLVDLIIIGAGPAGLSAAEAAAREGLDYLVIEKGTIANTIRQYPVGRTMFSTPNEVEMHPGHTKARARKTDARGDAVSLHPLRARPRSANQHWRKSC